MIDQFGRQIRFNEWLDREAEFDGRDRAESERERHREPVACRRCGRDADGSAIMCHQCWVETGEGLTEEVMDDSDD